MTSDTDGPRVFRGACLCGATRYEVAGPLDDVVLCHCTMCRRANGSAFNVGVVVDRTRVRFLATNAVREFESSPGKYRAFCGGCGAPVYSRRADAPEHLRLRGGLILDLPRPADLRHWEHASRWPWIDGIADAPVAS